VKSNKCYIELYSIISNIRRGREREREKKNGKRKSSVGENRE
jgi:hypothetical protein